MRRAIFALLVLVCLAAGTAAQTKWDVVVVPVSGVVDFKLARHLSRALQVKAEGESPVLYILEMDSFGGRVDAAFQIVDSVLASPNGKTVAYVKSKAISAAAMIALSCNAIYMHENATLGDCAPIIHTFDGPKEAGEKFQSPLRAKFRALAAKNGYPVKLAEAMITKEMQIYHVEAPGGSFYGDETEYRHAVDSLSDSLVNASIVVKTGELLTMNPEEALKLGFSRKTVSSVQEILDDMQIGKYSIRRLSPPRGLGWTLMSRFEKMYWFLAIPATILFLIMALLTFIGLGESELADDLDVDTDADADMGGDVHADSHAGMHVAHDGTTGFFASFHLFTVRNFIVFFMMFGWSGIAMIRSNAHLPATIVVSMVIGMVMMFLVSLMFYLVSKLVHSGNVSIRAAIGQCGDAYLAVPEKRSGTGKVNVIVEGKKIEYKAMTKGKRISTGESVKVVGLVGSDILLVEKL